MSSRGDRTNSSSFPFVEAEDRSEAKSQSDRLKGLGIYILTDVSFLSGRSEASVERWLRISNNGNLLQLWRRL